jgi:hypothetical protein
VRQHVLFKLDQNPKGRGLRCDSDGLFLGCEALLQRDARGNFEARPVAELQKILGRVYGDATNWASRIRSVELVAKALNKGEMARAMMTAVLMRLPAPRDPVRITDVDDVLAKAGFNPDEPRDEMGRWTIGGDSAADDANAPDRGARIQLADAGPSDASDDPVAQAAARAAAIAARHNHRSGPSQNKPGASARNANSWITQYRNLWAAIVAFFGNPQNTTRAAEDVHKLASRILGSHLSKAPGVRAIYYHRTLSTITNGQIQSGRLPDVTVVMEDNTVQPYEILSPKQIAANVESKYEGIRLMPGSQFRLAKPKIMSIDKVMALPEAASIAAEEEEAQTAIATEEAKVQAAITVLEEDVEVEMDDDNE